MLWFVIAALMEERVPTLHPGEYIFDYVVGKIKAKNTRKSGSYVPTYMQLGLEHVDL